MYVRVFQFHLERDLKSLHILPYNDYSSDMRFHEICAVPRL